MTLNTTFKEFIFAVDLEKGEIGCQFKERRKLVVKERANQHPVIIHPTFVTQKNKRKGEDFEGTSSLLFFKDKGWVKN